MARVIRESPLQRKALEDANVAEAEVREAKASLLPQLNLWRPARCAGRSAGIRKATRWYPCASAWTPSQGLFQLPPADRRGSQRLESAKWSADAMQRDIRRQLQNLFDNGDTLRWREQSLTQQVTESEQVGELYREQVRGWPARRDRPAQRAARAVRGRAAN
ncbi:putative outer membrane protein [Pseudomonas aeruginosa]|nr:putative outer membrane protein [Pseudomonas aeruginosa]